MLYELLKKRRSIRKYQNEEVEKEKLDAILKSALMAPSSRNLRTWEFVAVTDKGLLQELSRCREFGSQHLAGAPLAIVVAEDPAACDVWTEDASIAATIIQLSAQSLGLGSCWIQVRERFGPDHVRSADIIKKALGIPDKYDVECVITIGYPAEKKNPHDESELPLNRLHYNTF